MRTYFLVPTAKDVIVHMAAVVVNSYVLLDLDT